MRKSLFGGKKRSAKSINDIRNTRKKVNSGDIVSRGIDHSGRVKAKKVSNLKQVEIKAALADAIGGVPRPDIPGAIGAAKALLVNSDPKEYKAALNHALRLKQSVKVIDEALAHPARRYLAMAVIRSLLEEARPSPKRTADIGERVYSGPNKRR
ncbi:MAG: hypothetical protein ACJZ9F_00975 [Rhodospirillaceae bacterium]